MTIENEQMDSGRVPSEPGSREPSPSVSAASGFDPSRGCRFRKKPVIIEAVRFLRVASIVETHFDGPVPGWLSEAMDSGVIRVACGSLAAIEMNEPNVLAVHTSEGEMMATPGDWIIRGIKGELYPCKPDIFEASYEQCDSDGSPEGRDREDGLDGAAATARADRHRPQSDGTPPLVGEEEIERFLKQKYVQRADERQRAMGLQYMEAETHDLAKELARFLTSLRTGVVRQEEGMGASASPTALAPPSGVEPASSLEQSRSSHGAGAGE